MTYASIRSSRLDFLVALFMFYTVFIALPRSSRITLFYLFLFYFIYFCSFFLFFFFQAEDGIRDVAVTGVQTCALPISPHGLALPALRAHCGNSGRRPWQRGQTRASASGGAGAEAGLALILGIDRFMSERSEERRVGKEGRARGGSGREKKKESMIGGGL